MLQETLDFNLLKMCADCGACYDICPSSLHFEEYDPRAVIKDIVAGTHEKWITHDSIWQCLECHYCVEMCYQHYGFENAMTAMRRLATQHGHHPPQLKKGWDMFVKSSKLGEPAMPARKKFGLPAPPKSDVETFAKLVEAYKESASGAAENE